MTSGAGGPQPSDGVWFLKRGASRPVHVVRGLSTALGLTWLGGRLYVASVRTPARGQVTVLQGFDGRRFARSRRLLGKLPIGRHTVDTIVPDRDGRRLYLGVGSEFDNRVSSHALSGTVVSFTPAGRDLRLEARGLRNPYGLAFIPQTDRLLITDNARDDLIAVGLRRRADGGYDASKRRFATGFARHDPLGAALGPDGALYVTLFSSGGVVRFTPPR